MEWLKLSRSRGWYGQLEHRTLYTLPFAVHCKTIGSNNSVKENFLSPQAPPEAERNGIIIRYDIFYREMGETNSTSSAPLSVFSVAEYTPSDPQASDHSTRLGGLAGGKKYQVKLRAATSVGVGPNSTLVSTETLERKYFTHHSFMPCLCLVSYLIEFHTYCKLSSLLLNPSLPLILILSTPHSSSFLAPPLLPSSIPSAAGTGDRYPSSNHPPSPLPPGQPLSLLSLLLPQVSGW